MLDEATEVTKLTEATEVPEVKKPLGVASSKPAGPMTTVQTTRTAQPFKLALEVATFDWRSPRVQFFLGFLLTLVTFALVTQEYFATRFLAQEYFAVGKLLTDGVSTIEPSTGMTANPLLYLQLISFTHHAWWYRIICFGATALAAMSVGLITLELTIRYGNRIGAAPALFAALLYLAVPYENSLTMPATMLPVLLSNFFALFAVFLDLRFRLLRENGYYLLALLSLVLAGVLDVDGIVVSTLGLALTRFLVVETERRNHGGPLLSYVGLTIYFLVMILFLVPHATMALAGEPSAASVLAFLSTIASGSLQIKIIQRVLPVLLITTFSIVTIRLVIGSLWLRPILFAGTWSAASIAAWILLRLDANSTQSCAGIFLAPPICMLLAMCALPAVDTLTRKMRITLTTIGTLVLSTVIVFWGILVEDDIRDNYIQARDLGLFKVELTKRTEITAGKLAVINPPFEVSPTGFHRPSKPTAAKPAKIETTEVDSVEGEANAAEFNNPEAVLAEKRGNDEVILQAMLCSQLNGQPILVETKRRLPIAFIRINKIEQATSKEPAAAVTDFYVWMKETGQLMPVYYSGAKSVHLQADETVKVEPAGAARIKSDQWAQIQNGRPYVETSANGLRLNAGDSEDLTVWLPMHRALDPTRAGTIFVTCAPLKFAEASPLSLVFKGKDAEEIGSIELHKSNSENSRETTTLQANTKGIADWNKHNSIAALGVKLQAGNPGVVIKSIDTAEGAK
jgi:hypothetical protein